MAKQQPQQNNEFVIPMSSKAGIQRDVSSFSSTYFTDGFWVRFLNGTPKKMGAQYAFKIVGNDSISQTKTLDFEIIFSFPQNQRKPLLFSLNAVSIPDTDNSFYPSISAYYLNSREAAPGDRVRLIRLANFTQISEDLAIAASQFNGQITAIIRNGRKQPLALVSPYLGAPQPAGAPGAENFYSTLGRSIFFAQDGNAPDLAAAPFTDITGQMQGLDPGSNIGMCFLNPYLFIYGANGNAQYSAINDPYNFAEAVEPDRAAMFRTGAAPREGAPIIPNIPDPLPPDANVDIITCWQIIDSQYITSQASYIRTQALAGSTLRISSKGEPVLCAHPLRGGPNYPSLLFWTTTELVRIYNIRGDDGVNFQREVISNNISTASSKCVVEYNNAFWWRGLNSFYIYNGVSLEVRNPVNGQFLFRNEDPDKRHLAFTVANPTYGEIWFFYAEKPRPATVAGQPAVTAASGVTRAVIFCEREPGGVYFDTIIRRSAGYYISEWGSMVTVGTPLIEDDNYNYFWEHIENDATTKQVLVKPSDSNPPVLGQPIRAAIESFYTTSVISFAAPVSSASNVGVDTTFTLLKFEPDYVMSNRGAQIGVTPQIRMYAQDIPISMPEVIFTGNTNFVPMNVQCAHLQLRFRSAAMFHQGKPLLTLGRGSKQR
jgi:hypothetical protein